MNKESSNNNDNIHIVNDNNTKAKDAVFLKGYKVSYYHNDAVKETYTYIYNHDNDEQTDKEREHDKNDGDYFNKGDDDQNESNVQRETLKKSNFKGVERIHDHINLKDLLKKINMRDKDKVVNVDDGIIFSSSSNSNDYCGKSVANINDKSVANVDDKSVDARTEKPKLKLNMDKIKNIVEKNENEVKNIKNTSIPIETKINIIIKKLNNKIKNEVVKDLIEYETILKQTGETVSRSAKVNAFYHFVLNKINSYL
jgi:hypothetical protein